LRFYGIVTAPKDIRAENRDWFVSIPTDSLAMSKRSLLSKGDRERVRIRLVPAERPQRGGGTQRRGTESLNLSPSSGESANFRFLQPVSSRRSVCTPYSSGNPALRRRLRRPRRRPSFGRL
jgi:hypothetical protein